MRILIASDVANYAVVLPSLHGNLHGEVKVCFQALVYRQNRPIQEFEKLSKLWCSRAPHRTEGKRRKKGKEGGREEREE